MEGNMAIFSPLFRPSLAALGLAAATAVPAQAPSLAMLDRLEKGSWQLRERGKDTVRTAYPPKQIAAWAERLQVCAAGKAPGDLPCVTAIPKRKAAPRDVFAYVIHEGKMRAPAGAMALIAKLTA